MTAPTPTPRLVSAPLSLGAKLGRVGRAVLGCILALGDISLLVVDTWHREPVTTPDLLLHGGLLVAALALIDRSLLDDVVQRGIDVLKAWRGA